MKTRAKKKKQVREEEMLPPVPIARPPGLGLFSNGVYTGREFLGFFITFKIIRNSLMWSKRKMMYLEKCVYTI